MIKKNMKRHSDRLMKSQPDDIELLIAVVDRYNGLLEHYLRIKGEHLLIPTEMASTQKVVERIKERYQRSDFRHSESEKKALRDFAQWTYDVNCEMRNQQTEEIVWKD